MARFVAVGNAVVNIEQVAALVPYGSTGCSIWLAGGQSINVDNLSVQSAIDIITGAVTV